MATIFAYMNGGVKLLYAFLVFLLVVYNLGGFE